jgi:hypothetical protein
MRVPHDSEREINVSRAGIRETNERSSQKLKLNTSLERKIEQLYRKSETLGWSFTDFCAHVLEVLAVLHHRKKVKRLTAIRVERRQDNRRLT